MALAYLTWLILIYAVFGYGYVFYEFMELSADRYYSFNNFYLF